MKGRQSFVFCSTHCDQKITLKKEIGESSLLFIVKINPGNGKRRKKGRIIIKNTFAYENVLPSLPIPPLTSTESKLLEWVEPLLSVEQFQETSEVAHRFFGENGEAQKLQKKLHEWKDSIEGSWLKPFWDDQYLKYRKPLPTGMHFNILLDNQKYKKQYSMPELAGKVSYFVTELYHSIIDGKFEPVTINEIPLDMSQYKKFFRSVRIPMLERDDHYVAEFDKKNNHIVIIYKSNMYKVKVTNSEGAIYQSKKIARAVEKAFQAEDSEGLDVGIFTTAKRDSAAKVYNELIVSKINANNLQVIADSLIVISVDEESNSSEEAIENLMLNGTNKYFDKTIQVVITKSGELGYSIEHSAVDGTTIFTVISYVNEGLCKEASEIIYTTEKPVIEKLEWEISEEISESLTKFKSDYVQTKKTYDVKSRTFTNFGSDEIKKVNISPDAFLHMALQIAQYRTFGMLRSVYEPVSVRVFHEGRTECARATSMEKLKLVTALEAGEENNEILYSLMQKAGAAHTNRIISCRKGFGVERHMYGLEQMYYLNGASLGIKDLPEIFTDEGYLTMRHDFISTSGMAYDNVKYRIFGPVVEGGYGLAYILLDQSISINVSCNAQDKEYAKRLADHLVQALDELMYIAKSSIY
ncbi:choline/carnitine O-acyltransferase [Sporosarcina sp. G11-34]|uniref:choline/carnitine O-acyltransferase n=1 Tax=Sporosarcina sp. G11-34 TaxID=2849605 RepID=UPI0022A9D71D|nr:choline/carnitine O-acyltransferase [Sporosarcina sp. G11-34]MCZ2258213.1 choline/carnitine O-acyltransferase [Sporosarcina sp. G11-34]